MAKTSGSLDKALQPFANASDSLGTVDAATASSLISASADIALVLDPDGVVRDVSLTSPELQPLDVQSWIGRAWRDVVTDESRDKVDQLMADANARRASRWRQVNHTALNSPDVPVRYSTVRLAPEGRIIAVGRDLRAVAALQQRLVEAQLSMEREYARVRGAETRYRLLFQLAAEAVVIVDAGSNRIVDINPAASKTLALQPRRAIGLALADAFDPQSAAAVLSLLAAARHVGRIEDVMAKLADGKTAVLLSASLFRHDSASHLLVRLRTLNPAAAERGTPVANILQIIERLPEAFAVTDLDHTVLAANSAFLDLVQVATEQQVKGKPIERWIGRVGVDVEPLFSALKTTGSVRNFDTVLRGELEGVETVEIAAVLVESGSMPCIGFSIRGTGWRRQAGVQQGTPIATTQQFTDLLGRVSLKDMVRETTDLIERLCIEAALELTRDNRASAAEILGLSRQSLYAKLRRFGLGDYDTEDASEPPVN